MSDINELCISGRLTRDPAMRETKSGTAVVNFTIASNKQSRNKTTGEKEERTTFLDCLMFGSRATGIGPYLRKGQVVFLSGELQYKTWDKDGRTMSKHELLVDDVKMPDKAQQQGLYAEQQRFAAQQYGYADQGPYGDDICF